MRQLAARVHTILAWILFLGSNLAFFLIALSVFGAASSSVHGAFGRILFLIALLLLITALIARSSRLNVALSVLIPLLLFGQGMFIYLPALPPVGRSFHAINGLAIMWLAYLLAHGRARAVVRSSQLAVGSYQSGD